MAKKIAKKNIDSKITKPRASRNDAKKTGSIATRSDGWMNVLTGQGVAGKDRQLSNTFGAVYTLTEQVVSDIYRGDGFGRRIIDLPTADMVRAWISVDGDPDNTIVKYLIKHLSTRTTILQALRWEQLFGGSLIVMGINDGGTLEEPVNENRIKEIEFLKAYDRYRISWTTSDFYDDPHNKKYNTPEFYTINPISLGSASQFRVHESRVLLFPGLMTTDEIRSNQEGWGDSVYQSGFTQLANYAGIMFSSKNIIDEFIQSIIKMDNLAELVSAGRENEIRERINIIDLSKHIINSVLLDKEEDYDKKASSVAGLSQLIEQFGMNLSAVYGIPYSILMGDSTTGFDSKNEGNIRAWYDKIREMQESRMQKPLERLVELILLSSDNPLKMIPENWAIVFNPLWQPTLKETIETRKSQAEIDQIYINSGVLDPVEVTANRFGGDTYSHETIVDVESRPDFDEPANPEEMEEEDVL